MTFHTPTRIFDVALTPLDACEMRVHAATPYEARALAITSWLDGDDATAFMAEDDYWTVEELLTGRA
jgi:hypothetical protein